MAFSNTKPHMSLLLATFMTCFLLLLSKGMSADSVSFTFNRFPNNVRDITFRGDARATDGVLLLNRVDGNGNPARLTQGQAVYHTPIHLWESSTGRVATFTTNFDMIIRRTVPTQGDGLTFFLNPVGTTIRQNSTGGHLGIFGPNSVNQFVAVEFDTFRNEWDPVNTPHIGLNINRISSEQTENWNTAGVPNGALARVTIQYSANTKQLSVTLFYPNVAGSPRSTLIYRNLDFTKRLPEWVQVGFSGSTGNEVQIQQIRSWSFTSNLIGGRISEDIIKEVV